VVENYEFMKILVTGGAGFIGTNLIKSLLSEGHSVVSVDNYNTGLKSNHQDGCLYLNKDIRTMSDYSAWGDFDVVYHLAAIARIQPSFQDPESYFTTNANATMKLARYCASKNIPLIYAGSSSHHSGKYKNPYTFSKDIGEEIIQLFQQHYGLKSSIARFYNVYGPYQLKEGGYTTLIGAWEKLIEEDKPLVIYGDGEKRRDFNKLMEFIHNVGISKTLLVQEYLGLNPGEDIRVLVIGGKVIGAMKRTAPKGDFRANISNGGTGEKFDVTPEIDFIARETARVLNLHIAGIDLLFHNDGFVVCEANTAPGFKGFEKYCDVDIAELIVEYIDYKLFNKDEV
jgi:hypothetical protein